MKTRWMYSTSYNRKCLRNVQCIYIVIPLVESPWPIDFYRELHFVLVNELLQTVDVHELICIKTTMTCSNVRKTFSDQRYECKKCSQYEFCWSTNYCRTTKTLLVNISWFVDTLLHHWSSLPIYLGISSTWHDSDTEGIWKISDTHIDTRTSLNVCQTRVSWSSNVIQCSQSTRDLTTLCNQWYCSYWSEALTDTRINTNLIM